MVVASGYARFVDNKGCANFPQSAAAKILSRDDKWSLFQEEPKEKPEAKKLEVKEPVKNPEAKEPVKKLEVKKTKVKPAAKKTKVAKKSKPAKNK